jgi:hypothetical protein
MNMSETYLLRDDAKKNAAMLIAALNHSYTTNVFKEEILTDVTKDRACDTPHSKRENMEGTGDMPEAWGNANAVDLLRDMLVQERTDAPVTDASKTTLHLLAGLPAEWIAKMGETASVEHTPTTLGTVVSLKLTRGISPNKMQLQFDPGARETDVVIHVPIPEHYAFVSAKIDGKEIPVTAISTPRTPDGGRATEISLPGLSRPINMEINFGFEVETNTSAGTKKTASQ